MRTLRRNQIRIFYANYRDKIPIKDEYGNLTGEYKISYHNPIAIMANVSVASGEVTTRQFGADVSYDRIIVLDDPSFPMTESSIWWIDTLPDIAEDGSTKTPHDHIVKRVAPSLNSMSIAVSRVSITQYPTDNDSYIDLRNDCHGNVSILSNSLSVIDDGSGNVIIKAGEV
jgi:hypothetical protein